MVEQLCAPTHSPSWDAQQEYEQKDHLSHSLTGRQSLYRFTRTYWIRARRRQGGTAVSVAPVMRAGVEPRAVPHEHPDDTNSAKDVAAQTQDAEEEAGGISERRSPIDNATLSISAEAQAARARGIPVLHPLAERQAHRLTHIPYRNWC